MKKTIFLLITFMTLILTGCSDTTSEVVSTDTKIVDIEGVTTEIPAEPQRIVTDYYVGELLMLDANLVGADLTYTSTLWGDYSDIVNVGQSMESVAALSPDLIITINEAYVDQYSAIAPTILVPYGTYNPETLLTKLAEITNTADSGSEWVAEFNTKVDKLDKLVNHDETYTILELFADGGYYYGAYYGRSGYILYDKLGLKSTTAAQDDYVLNPESYLAATDENLSKYVGDNLILVVPDNVDMSSHSLVNNVVWDSLDAVKNDKVYVVSADDFWYSDPYSLDKQIDILTDILNGNYKA